MANASSMGGTTSGVLRIPSECILWEEMGVNFLHPLMGLSFYGEWSSTDQRAFPDPFWGDFVHSHSVNRRLVFLQKDNSVVLLLSPCILMVAWCPLSGSFLCLGTCRPAWSSGHYPFGNTESMS